LRRPVNPLNPAQTLEEHTDADPDKARVMLPQMAAGSYIKVLGPRGRRREDKKYHRLHPPCIKKVSNLELLPPSTIKQTRLRK
jgi:hypothetical protein